MQVTPAITRLLCTATITVFAWPVSAAPEYAYAKAREPIYAKVPLTADLSGISDQQRTMLSVLIKAANIMDDLFWEQAYGSRASILRQVEHPALARFIDINYGPWDRLAGDKPFLSDVGAKPLGANFYPPDMTRQEFEAADLPGKEGLYSLVRRNESGELTLIPYSAAYRKALIKTSALLNRAADLASDPGFERYLRLRGTALLSDEYFQSDMAWMEMKNNTIDVVIGPIETYEDQLFGYRAAFEAYVLLKDIAWSERLARFAAFLPDLQKGLPVAQQYKQETPGTDSDLNAYDVLYYAGHSNAGSKTIAINLPNDEQVQLAKGTRRLQLKNAMRAKFDKILLPISQELIVPAQRKHITFDAFFANTMFHEVAHGLGIKNTLDGKGTVRQALKDAASALEEGKADILGLYMVTWLHQQKELGDADLMDNYVTFMASIFRSVRFGASSAHGRANMIRFNFFAEKGAFKRDRTSGHYQVDFARMQQAMGDLSSLLLTIQGDGDYTRASALLNDSAVIGAQLQSDLDRLGAAGIPVDIVFKQGPDVLGLE